MAHAILELLGKPYSLIRHVTDRPGHDRRYSLNVAKIGALGWQSRHTFETGDRADGALVRGERVVVAQDQERRVYALLQAVVRRAAGRTGVA